MRFGTIVLQVTMYRLTSQITSHSQAGGHDVISCRKVLPPAEWTRSVYPAPMQQRVPVPDP